MTKIADLLSEVSGFFRLRALLRGGSISFGASVKSPSLLSLGRRVAIQRGCFIHCGGKAWSGGQGGVSIGDDVTVGPNCVIYGAGGVSIARCTHLGPAVILISQGGRHDQDRLGPVPNFVTAPIVIGEGSWIGAGSVVVAGSTIGRCATIAPNSVVTGKVPDFAVFAGNPGRVMLMNKPLD